MQIYKTQDQIDADYRHFEQMEAAERISNADSKEIAKRHKQYKQKAKNLAGLKGADKNALLYERMILKARLDEIDNYLIKKGSIQCSNFKCWIDEDEGCYIGEIDPKECGHYQASFE